MSVTGARQLLEHAARTALACDSSLAQARTLASIALAAGARHWRKQEPYEP